MLLGVDHLSARAYPLIPRQSPQGKLEDVCERCGHAVPVHKHVHRESSA